MSKWLKDNGYKLVLSVLVFVVIIPLVINWLFKQNLGIELLVAEWQADAALGFYGNIVSAIFAVYGVFLTIQYSQQNYKEDVRNRSLPFIVIDLLKTKSHISLISKVTSTQVDDEWEGYQEYKLQDYYCILENGNISYKTGLNKNQQAILNNAGTRWVQNASGGSLVVVDNICVPIEIENVGNGAAIRLRYGLNKKETPEKERKFLPVISLKPESPILLHIFSEDCSKSSSNLGNYILSFRYDDIFSNKYQQDFEVAIEYSEEKNCPVVSVDMSHKQEVFGGVN